jgi:hypothetical protein
VRFLIDECLSIDLVAIAGQCGHEARHVAHAGRAGWKDWNENPASTKNRSREFLTATAASGMLQ